MCSIYRTEEREITVAEYERGMANNGCLTGPDREKVFSQPELNGYGVYGAEVVRKDEKYYVRYSLGSTCD